MKGRYGRVDERLFDGPWGPGPGPGQSPVPFLVCKLGDQSVKQFELMDGASDHFSTSVTH